MSDSSTALLSFNGWPNLVERLPNERGIFDAHALAHAVKDFVFMHHVTAVLVNVLPGE